MTPHFPLGKLNAQLHSDGKHITLLSDFVYEDEEKDILVLIPAGYVSDGNSVPKAAQGYFGRWEVPTAGVVHDWLYDHPDGYERLSSGYIGRQPLTKAECDDLHRRLLDLGGIRPTKRNLLYGILRMFGGVAWKRHRDRDPQPVVVDDE